MGNHVFVRIKALGRSQQCFIHTRMFSSVKQVLSNNDEVSCSQNTEVSSGLLVTTQILYQLSYSRIIINK